MDNKGPGLAPEPKTSQIALALQRRARSLWAVI